MLKNAKSKFETDVKDLLENSMFHAFQETFIKGDDELLDAYMEDSIKKVAKKFADKVSDLAAVKLTDAIDEYIKASGLFINVGPAGIALSGSTGPVTGTITINPSTSQISIR